MEITTKFDIGDKLWRLENNKARSFEIGCIMYEGMVCYGETRYDALPEAQCFATKDELIQSIIEDGD